MTATNLIKLLLWQWVMWLCVKLHWESMVPCKETYKGLCQWYNYKIKNTCSWSSSKLYYGTNLTKCRDYERAFSEGFSGSEIEQQVKLYKSHRRVQSNWYVYRYNYSRVRINRLRPDRQKMFGLTEYRFKRTVIYVSSVHREWFFITNRDLFSAFTAHCD